MTAHYLSKIFEPTSIAVIGASDRDHSIGMKVFKNILENGFDGALYAVNPKHQIVQNKTCFAAIGDINQHVDLAIITTPANTIPKLISECGNKGIHHIVILSSGFSEIGVEGKVLENHIANVAKGYHIHLVGPNCLGIMRPSLNMNATLDNIFGKQGRLAFVSQSGSLMSRILDWAVDKNIGFSTLLSLGNSVDVDFADVLDYLAVDPKTESILMYIEGIHHSRKFMSALRAAARMKPVIVIKAGRHPTAASLVGDDEVFDTALRRAGAVRVKTIEELFLAAEMLSGHYRVNGNKLLIITNSNSAGIMAADRALDLNIQLPTLTEATITELDKVLSKHWSHQNPVDILEDATPERYQRVLEICAKDENVDGILVMVTPLAMASPFSIAEMLIKESANIKQPLLACWMGEKNVKSSWQLFADYQFPYFDSPEKAIQAFSYLTDYHLNQQLLLQVPEPLSPQAKPDIAIARQIISKTLAEKRNILTSLESKAMLAAFFIPAAQELMIKNPHDRELFIGVLNDIVFGPVISFGAGGRLIEIMKDKTLTLPPLNAFLTKQIIEQTRIANMPAINLDLIVKILLRVSEMVCEIPEIVEMDINPLMINDQTAVVADVKIVIQACEKPTKHYAHMAIHPYPKHLISSYDLENGSAITIRPIRPEDALMIQTFVRNLSPQSKYFRFMRHIRELTPETLVRLTQIDYDREMTFVATYVDHDVEQCAGVAHYITNPDRESCEFAIAVADDWQNKKIGSRLMRALCAEAKMQGLSTIMGIVLATNIAMLEMTHHLGFEIMNNDDPTMTIIVKSL